MLVVDPNGVRALPARPFREGMFGATLEDALQRLIEEYPGVLPGAQMDPGGADPPRFVLLRREMPVSAWALDHLLVDQHGVLTLLEAKLMENPESRRAVIGQIMDYAANASEYWGRGKVRELAAEFWATKGKDVDAVLSDAFGADFDSDTLWEDVERNLEQGRIRLVVAGDEIRPEARRVLEYLNQEMANAEVFGLELTCYGTDEKTMVVVPRLIGQTVDARDRKRGHPVKQTWPLEQLREVIDASTPEGNRFLAILEWAAGNGSFLDARTVHPSFAITGPAKRRIVSVYDKDVFCWTGRDRYRDADTRDTFLATLRGADLLARDFNADEVAEGRYLSKKLAGFSDSDTSFLLDALMDAIR